MSKHDARYIKEDEGMENTEGGRTSEKIYSKMLAGIGLT